jgi:hypothetical protein
MKRTGQYIFSVTIMVAVVLTTLSASARANDASINKVVKAIETCPAWRSASDDLSRKKLLVCLEGISKNDLNVIRMAMERYIAFKRKRNSYDVDSMSRLYLLNRYIFDVPEKAEFSRSTFGGWMGVPHSSQEINLLWPLSFDRNGKLALTGRFAGYMGDDYLALEEFDHFKETYGQRPRKEETSP